MPGTASHSDPLIAVAPRPRATSTATGERSTPSPSLPSSRSRARWRPGPQPRSSTGASIDGQDGLVGRVAGREPAVERKRLERAVRAPDPRRGRRTVPVEVLDRAGEQAPVERVGGQRRRVLGGPEEAARRGARLVEPTRSSRSTASVDSRERAVRRCRLRARSESATRSAAANRLSRRLRRATARASSMVSTSSSGRRIAGVRPCARIRASWTAPVRSVLIGTSVEDGVVARLQADAPVAAVERHAERGAAVGDGAQALLEQLRRDLRRVHADEEGGLADVLERGGQALLEAVTALGDDFEAGGQPRTRVRRRGR